ncbi:hypothetical protein [Zavarzinella formosa]|uniref:hypothetical protein n=1 Tax=Zavarzinella formosa TaxID=360055 RepID=UPI00030885F9|nr:hypothetical protein [Zavarzinella formosa]
MRNPDPTTLEDLRDKWTDQFVRANPDKPEHKRFEGRVGRVVTVNWSGKAIIDFADGAWYDLPASEEYLTLVPADDPAKTKYDPKRTSAQARPDRQG